MKIYEYPYFDHADGLDIMIMLDPSEDELEVYYRMPGSPFIYAFGLPSWQNSMSEVIEIAKCNAQDYAEVLFG